MRQNLGPRKVEQLRKQTGLDIVAVQVRGNTGHRKDLFLRGGKIVHLYPDGSRQASTVPWVEHNTEAEARCKASPRAGCWTAERRTP